MPDPVIDPATGEPTTPPETPPTVSVPAEEWGAMKARLDVFEKNTYNQSTRQSTPQPTGPTFNDEIKEIEGKIDKLDSQIDKNVADGKPVSSLMKERSALDRQITRLYVKNEDIDPVINAGMQTIDQLSNEVSKGQFKYMDIVKKDYETLMQSIDPSQRASLDVKQKIYQMAVGQNMDSILEAKTEEILRKGHDNAGNPIPSNSGRQTTDDGIPAAKDILSREAINAIKSRGMTVDEYYIKRGHKDGWKGYFEKHKSYYEDKGLIDKE